MERHCANSFAVLSKQLIYGIKEVERSVYSLFSRGFFAAFLLLKLPIVLASKIEIILAFRFLRAFAGSPAQATGGATITYSARPLLRSGTLGAEHMDWANIRPTCWRICCSRKGLEVDDLGAHMGQ